MTHICGSAFTGKTLQMLSLPSSLTTIGESAFENCTALTTVQGADNITSYGQRAFSGCTKLASLSFTSALKEIGAAAFANTGFTEINLPTSVTTIGNTAFMQCKALKKANIPTANVKMGKGIYQSCSALTDISMPDELTVIPRDMFSNTALSTVAIPASVTWIDNGAFYMTKLKQVERPDGLRHLGQNVFYNTPLTSIVIPNHVDTIGQGCFNQCKKLRKAVIGTGTRVIAKSAFNSTALDSISLPEGLVEIQQLGISVNPYLKSMVLPSTLTTLGARSLFRNSFTSVTAKMTTPPNIREDLTNKIFADYTDWQGDSIYTYCTLYVPKGSLEVYQSARGWKLFQTIKEDDASVAGLDAEAERRLIGIFTIEGIRISEPVRGAVNIFRYSDGTVRKEIVR